MDWGWGRYHSFAFFQEQKKPRKDMLEFAFWVLFQLPLGEGPGGGRGRG